jgi:hypothetical protein
MAADSIMAPPLSDATTTPPGMLIRWMSSVGSHYPSVVGGYAVYTVQSTEAKRFLHHHLLRHHGRDALSLPGMVL